MVTAVYPGTFDPVTNGHVDIAMRSSRLFDKVIVGVYDSPPKTLVFSTEERVELFHRAIAHIPNVEVRPYAGLTVDFAKEMGATVVVRGLRMGSDFDYEFNMALMNKKLSPDVELVCLMTRLEYQFVSSSMLKEATRLGGDVRGLVPDHVLSMLGDRLGATKAASISGSISEGGAS
ncbi:MAG: pantetheine-phosphate adenylyltransferase [Chloroflexi bacterium]|jgi:pantetheine-phosphate adenylyltransferase|nr:MAG: pantetheine-phosphate adenylyltransferase [Chloroflexota bacterium]